MIFLLSTGGHIVVQGELFREWMALRELTSDLLGKPIKSENENVWAFERYVLGRRLYKTLGEIRHGST